MSRHARRRAAAKARRMVAHGTTPAPRRTGYAHRLVAAIGNGGLARGVHRVVCEHGPDCDLRHRGANCTCVPAISVVGADGITEIDEAGVPRKHVKQ
jgi:hypothetical protein